MGPKASNRKISLRSKKFDENINKRGALAKKKSEIVSLNYIHDPIHCNLLFNLDNFLCHRRMTLKVHH